MYFDHRVDTAPCCFSGFFQKMELRAHFNIMCFSFAGKTMAADMDESQLQDLLTFYGREMEIHSEGLLKI